MPGVPGFPDILRILGLQVSLYRLAPGNSEIPGLYLLRQVSLYRRPVKHPFAILENSTLRRDRNFFFRVLRDEKAPGLAGHPVCVKKYLRSTLIFCNRW